MHRSVFDKKYAFSHYNVMAYQCYIIRVKACYLRPICVLLLKHKIA